MLWKPDILLFNSADENFDARFDVNFVVRPDGSVVHAPPAIGNFYIIIKFTLIMQI